MVYLIGGAPRTGKTTMAKMLSKQLCVSYLPGDYLKSIVSLNPSKNITTIKDLRSKHKTNDELYYACSSMEIIKAYRGEAQSIFPALINLIEYATHDNFDLIIDGFFIEPNFTDLLSFESKNACREIYLGKTNMDLTKFSFEKNSTQHDWEVNKTAEKNTYSKIAKMVSDYSELFKELTDKYNKIYLSTDQDFKEQLQIAISEITV